MKTLPRKCVVDTNVPKTANEYASTPTDEYDKLLLIQGCIDATIHVMGHSALVIDAGDEIYDEYRKNLGLSGQPGPGNQFAKWVHDNRWQFAHGDRVPITRNGDTYNEFPEHVGLTNFDVADRKFVAVANAHKEKPPVLQATDSKWWGWKDALSEVGIIVIFMDPEYAQNKYESKFGGL